MPPQFFGDDISTVLQRLRELSGTHNCFPIVGDLDLLAEILKACSGIGRIVLKGCEASGFVSAETTQMLYSASKAMLSTSSQSPDIVIGEASPPLKHRRRSCQQERPGLYSRASIGSPTLFQLIISNVSGLPSSAWILPSSRSGRAGSIPAIQ